MSRASCASVSQNHLHETLQVLCADNCPPPPPLKPDLEERLGMLIGENLVSVVGGVGDVVRNSIFPLVEFGVNVVGKVAYAWLTCA